MADERDDDQQPTSAANDEADSPKPPAQGSLTAGSYDTDDVFENAEPWDPIETKMVLYSFATAIALLAIFSYFIDKYILP